MIYGWLSFSRFLHALARLFAFCFAHSARAWRVSRLSCSSKRTRRDAVGSAAVLCWLAAPHQNSTHTRFHQTGDPFAIIISPSRLTSSLPADKSDVALGPPARLPILGEAILRIRLRKLPFKGAGDRISAQRGEPVCCWLKRSS